MMKEFGSFIFQRRFQRQWLRVSSLMRITKNNGVCQIAQDPYSGKFPLVTPPDERRPDGFAAMNHSPFNFLAPKVSEAHKRSTISVFDHQQRLQFNLARRRRYTGYHGRRRWKVEAIRLLFLLTAVLRSAFSGRFQVIYLFRL